MGACASVTKAMRGKAGDDKAPLPEPATELPEVKADEEGKVESKNNESEKVVVDDQSANKGEEPENKDEQKTTAEAEELPKAAAPASAAGEAGKYADSTSEVKEEK